jgi:hypothetical protein
MSPTIAPPAVEPKAAPCAKIPSSLSAGYPFAAGYPHPAAVVQQAPISYASMPAAPAFQTQYFSAPPAPHPGYQPGPPAQPPIYYQPQAPPIQYMAPQPMYNPYQQPAPQPHASFLGLPPSSAYPPQQAVYYQVPQAPGPAQYAHPYPPQPAAVPHYHYPPQHPPAGGV